MKRDAVEELVSTIVEAIIADTDMELVDVEYVVNGTGIFGFTWISREVSTWMTAKWSVNN